MNCKKARKAMLLSAEGKLENEPAINLFKHVNRCRRCKDIYLSFDEMIETVASGDFVTADAPENFVESVMSKVSELPVYVSDDKAEINVSDVAVRVFWGVSAVIATLALLVMNNRESVNSFMSGQPLLSAISDVFTQIFLSIETLLVKIQEAARLISLENMFDQSGSFVVLVFVVVLTILLFVLQRGEKTEA